MKRLKKLKGFLGLLSIETTAFHDLLRLRARLITRGKRFLRVIFVGSTIAHRTIKNQARMTLMISVSFPNIGKSYSDLVSGMRGIVCEGYIIFYQVFQDRLVIVRLVNGHRDLSAVFSDFSNPDN